MPLFAYFFCSTHLAFYPTLSFSFRSSVHPSGFFSLFSCVYPFSSTVRSFPFRPRFVHSLFVFFAFFFYLFLCLGSLFVLTSRRPLPFTTTLPPLFFSSNFQPYGLGPCLLAVQVQGSPTGHGLVSHSEAPSLPPLSFFGSETILLERRREQVVGGGAIAVAGGTSQKMSLCIPHPSTSCPFFTLPAC